MELTRQEAIIRLNILAAKRWHGTSTPEEDKESHELAYRLDNTDA